MKLDSKAYDELWRLCEKYPEFKKVFDENIKSGKIRFFNDDEFDRIKSQNFMSPSPDMDEFIDMFILGYNIGNCVGASWQLSLSYDDVDIVSGILPILKGTRNAEKLGGHCWLERKNVIIDTTLMLVIDKSLKKEIGYVEENRLTAQDLASSPRYQARKEYTNDKSIKR